MMSGYSILDTGYLGTDNGTQGDRDASLRTPDLGSLSRSQMSPILHSVKTEEVASPVSSIKDQVSEPRRMWLSESQMRSRVTR